jgi:hypothetical protein
VRLLSIMGNPAYDMLGTQPEAIDGVNRDEVEAVCAEAAVVYLLLNAHYVEWSGRTVCDLLISDPNNPNIPKDDLYPRSS